MSDSQEIIGARYRLVERIGRGGMGTVWRARDEVLGRDVAVKEIIPSSDLSGPEREVFTVRTLREARAAGRIGHPGVATVYDVIEESGRPWIVMQLVDSRTLGAVVREDGPLPTARVARIGLDVLGALLAAHRAGVLHRDVKPDNVLLAKDGRAVLTDFGIATLEGDSSVTRTGALIGTPAFIAPERADGGPAEFASDLWSLGVTLYMAVEGRSPFERAHPLATLSAVMHEEPALRLAGSLAPVISGLLRKDPARRMTAQEVQAHLRSIVNGTEPQPTMPIALPSSPAWAPPPRDQASAPVAAAVPPPVAPPEPVMASTGARRRPALTALVATALAAVLTSGVVAWVTLNSSARGPAGPHTSVSVPSGDDVPKKTEQARLPSVKDPPPTGTEDGRYGPSAPKDPARSGKSDPADPAPPERPSRNGSEEGSKDGSEDGSGKGPRKEPGEKPEKDSGKDSGKGPGRDPGDDTEEDPGSVPEDDQGQGPEEGEESPGDPGGSGLTDLDADTGALAGGTYAGSTGGKTRKARKTGPASGKTGKTGSTAGKAGKAGSTGGAGTRR
ncbi:protein kinase [Streptosporangium sp. NPDC000396]|uniref:protein kinase domain-containing protein n=1 Tax=Streptosporangium sp. NPDC000396 TaxID=3366185 RepID=UPI0036C9EBD0